MERPRALRAGKAPRKRRRLSPLPGAAPPGPRAGASHSCRRSLFGTAGGGLKKKFSGKALPKIKENIELAEETPECNPSNQGNVRETRDLEEKEEDSQESSAPMKESPVINFETKEGLKNAEVSSSTGMTLPTGVSTFLIQCLDEESTADFNNTSDSLKSYSSPETFRSDASERSGPCVDPGKYRNSTLLDSSRAVTIDKILQLSNLSAILEPAPEDFQDQYIRRKKPSNCNYSSSELNISATLAGKKLCKITAAGERTPDLESGMRCSSPLGARSKLDSQTAKPKRLKGKKKETNFGLSEEGSSSFRQLDAPGSTSAANPPDLAEAVPPKAADAVVVQMTSTMLVEENKPPKNPGSAQPAKLDLSLSPVYKASPGEGLLLNTTGPYVNSEEIVPASLSSENTPQSPEEKSISKPLCDRKEICSIVRMSPGQRSSSLKQAPVKRRKFCPPRGVPEDSITSTKNWIYL